MKFYPNQIFHVYNQGNNKRTIFFTDENYEFFLWKMRAYLPPFADLIAYCLMPTHFHWLINVHTIHIERKFLRINVKSVEQEWKKIKYGNEFRDRHPASRKQGEDKMITLNDSIGILERTYSQAINKANGWSGSLFREACKSKDGWNEEFSAFNYLNENSNERLSNANDYVIKCKDYIHNNPKIAGLVEENTDWKYSSARAYAGLEVNHILSI